MRLTDIHKIISQSSNEDWNHIPCWGADSGPSFRDCWDKFTSAGEWELHHDSHKHVLVFNDDVRLSVSWGMGRDKMTGRTPGWLEAFPMVDDVYYFWADIFWNGALIDRHGLVAHDGGRVYLPLPTPVYQDVNDTQELLRYEVTHWHSAFARLLHYVEHQEDFDATLQRAGFTLVDHLSGH